MALYLRKAFTLGPVRLNLSKSGLGLSAGVKGLRVGTGPRGAYVHGGRHGVYVRQSLGQAGSRDAAPATEPRDSEPTPTDAPERVAITPDITLEVGATPSTLRLHLAPSHTASIITFIVGLGVSLVLLAQFWPLGLAGIAATFWLAHLVVGRQKEYARRLNTYLNRLATLFCLRTDLPKSSMDAALQMRVEGGFESAHLDAIHRFIYTTALGWFMRDGSLTDKELGVLDQAKMMLRLSTDVTNHAKLHAFQLHCVRAIADHDLTEEEEHTLRHYLDALCLPKAAVETELRMIATLHDAREIQGGKITAMPVDIKLQKDETCYHHTHGQQVETRVLRSYQEGGVRKKEEGLVPTKEGEVYVTSKRFLFVAGGVTAIPLTRVLDIDVDTDAGTVELQVEGRKTALRVAVPEPFITAAHLECLSRQAN
jgi:hypothetical protein